MTSQPVIYEQTDIPPGMTCGEYRRRKLDTDRRSVRTSRLPRAGRLRGVRLRSR
jgi:hypothetical protein